MITRVIAAIVLMEVMAACGRKMPPDHYTYTGDGKIEYVQTRNGLLPVWGFIIDLPDLPLDKVFDHTYALGQMPKDDEGAVIYFVLEEKLRALQSAPSPFLSVEILGEKGVWLAGWSHHLHELTWAWPIYGRKDFGLYDENNLGFHSPDTGSVFVKIHYDPGANASRLAGEKANLTIEAIHGGK